MNAPAIQPDTWPVQEFRLALEGGGELVLQVRRDHVETHVRFPASSCPFWENVTPNDGEGLQRRLARYRYWKQQRSST